MNSKLLLTLLASSILQLTFGIVKTYKAPKEIVLSKDFVVKVNNQAIDIYASRTRYGSNANFGYFDFSDSVIIEVSTKNPAPHSTKWDIIPHKYNISFNEIKNGTIQFALKKPANLTFVIMGDYWGRTLHLFANAMEADPPQKDTPGVIYFEPGYHEINPENNFTLNIESNQKVYIAGGAVVKGILSASNSENIKIYGRGILMQSKDTTLGRGIDIEACNNISIDGIIINRTIPNWSGFIYKSDNITINDLKVISPAIWSCDGINIANSSNANYTNCFFRTGNNCIAIKGLGNDRNYVSSTIEPNTALPNENIHIKDCIFWSDNNNALVLGEQTIAEYYRNISFKNCDILFVRDEEPNKAALSIIALHSTPIENILFENIRVGCSGQLIAVFNTEEIFGNKGSQAWPGNIQNVRFKNIHATDRGSKTIRINGWNNENLVQDIKFDNITLNTDTLSTDSWYLHINEYTKNIIINGDTIKKPTLLEPVPTDNNL